MSMMELNSKSPLLWDLETLVMYNTKANEAPKTLHLVGSEIDGIEGFEVGSFYSSGDRCVGGTGSELGYSSSSKSSKSVSVDSSTDREMKETRFSLEKSDGFQQDFRRKRDYDNFGPTRTSPQIESSAASGESLTALELCNRTYFEDVSGASPVKNNAETSLPPDFSPNKCKPPSLSVEIPRCQVEGCNVDLSAVKDYHRKHRVCEKHAKSPKVVIDGHERRFCQQCSRFHGISEFDQKKRSCRRRLFEHNARRRKPKPEDIQYNSMRLASSLHECRNQLNFAFNLLAKTGQFKSTDGLHSTHNGLNVSPVSNHFMPFKSTAPEVYHPGIPTSGASRNMDAAQDLRALSLLSTSSWSSGNPETYPFNRSMEANHTSMVGPLPAMHTVHLGGPALSSQYWQAQQPPSSTPGQRTSSSQLFKAPNESSFNLY